MPTSFHVDFFLPIRNVQDPVVDTYTVTRGHAKSISLAYSRLFGENNLLLPYIAEQIKEQNEWRH